MSSRVVGMKGDTVNTLDEAREAILARMRETRVSSTLLAKEAGVGRATLLSFLGKGRSIGAGRLFAILRALGMPLVVGKPPVGYAPPVSRGAGRPRLALYAPGEAGEAI